MKPRTLTAATLRQAGREPPLPFVVTLDGGAPLTLVRLLRVLPGRRIVGEAAFDGRRVLAKLFISRRASERHWAAEHDGIDALAAQQIPTAARIAAGKLAGGGHYLLTDFLGDATSLADVWAARDPAGAAAELLAPVFETLGRMHARGLAQSDLHLGNFLVAGDALHVIDGDAIRAPRPGKPLAAADATRNLALLLAQLPPDAATRPDALMAAYRRGNPGFAPAPARLQAEVARVRAWRLRDYLAKSLRDCSLFRVESRRDRFSAAVRAEAAALAPLLDDPDGWIARGTPLKDGRTATIARVEIGGRTLTVKRYNIKSAGHALSRFWRPSRAWHSWVEGHRLRFVGLATPAPLALVERRFGPLRGRAWLVTEYCDGPNLLAHLDPEREPPAAEAAALRALFAALARERIAHGDLKATNLLWHAGQIALIDIDAMRQCARAATHAKAWRRDRDRLLRNWPADSPLHRWLDANLPPA